MSGAAPRQFDDAAARQRIRTSLGESLIVEASAGTGKTSELVRRIVAVIEEGLTTIDHIAAVTFTHKAAGELKLRLRQGLDRQRSEATDAQKAKHLEDALARLEEASIGTIHSFCAGILRERPVEAVVDPAFEEVSEQAGDKLYERAFRSWIQEKLNENSPGLRRALSRLAWRESWDTAPPMEQLQRAGKTLIEWRDFPGAWLRMPFDRNAQIDSLLDHVMQTAIRVNDKFRALRQLANWIERNEAIHVRDYDTLETLLLRLRREKELKWKGAEQLAELLEAFRVQSEADLAAELRDEMWSLVERYEGMKRAAGHLDFLDLLLLTRNLIRDNREVRDYLQHRFTHLFIDEFQDTDPLQAEILLLLAADDVREADWMEARPVPGKLFVVGDPKQSIYRWRGGKAEQFIELSKSVFDREKNPFNNPEVVVENLKKNYRSYSKVIEFNNDFFTTISDEFENEDYKNLYQNNVVQEINSKIGGCVNISFLPKIEDIEDDFEEEIDKTDLYVLATLQTIKNCQKNGFQLRDIVVLTRKITQGIAVANYLTEQNIPILSSETLLIANCTEVRLIIFILKYLQNSSDLDSKANFLQYLAENAQQQLPTHDFIAKGMSLEIENEFENWLQNCNLNLSFANLRKKSLFEAVEIIISKFLNPKTNTAYVQYFLDIVLERDILNQAGISDFLNYWNKNAQKFSVPSPEGSNAVRIMTIHKSKGLEFPVVIFPFAEDDFNRKPKSKLWLEDQSETIDLPKVLIDNTKAIEGFGTEALAVYKQKKQEDLLDNLNVLYVTLTRAEEQLYVISAMNLDKNKAPRKENLSSFFINYLIKKSLFDEDKLEYQYGNQAKLSENKIFEDKTKIIPFVNELLDFRNIKIAQRESIMWGTQQQESIEYGNLIHEILSFVKTKNDIELALKKALESGLIATNQKKDVEKRQIN